MGSAWSLGRLHVAGAGSGSRQQALEFQGGDDIGVAAVAVLGLQFGVKSFKTRGQDDRPHLQGLGPGLLVVGNGPGLTGLDALHAFGTGAAVDAPGRLGLRLGLGEAQVDFLEAFRPLRLVQLRHGFPRRPGLAQRDGIPVAVLDGPERRLPVGLEVQPVKIPADGNRGFPPRGHRPDGDPGAGYHVAAGKDAGPRGGQGVRVGLDQAPGGEIDAVGRGDKLQIGLLADGHDDHVGLPGAEAVVEIRGRKAAGLVEDPGHRPQFQAGDLAVRRQDLLDP